MGLKLFVRVMMLVLVLALAGPFFIKGPDGDPMVTVADVKRFITRTAADAKRSVHDVRNDVARAAGDENAGKVEVHRWQDENGQWHYSNQVPASEQAETVYVDPDVNLMDPVDVSKRPRRSSPTAPSSATPGLLTPGRAVDIVNEAKDVREELEARNDDIKRRLDSIP